MTEFTPPERSGKASETTPELEYGAARAKVRRAQIARLVRNRLLLLVPLLGVISAGIFWLAEISPLDPLVGYLGDRYQFISAAQKQSLSETLQLNRSWFELWRMWGSDLLTGDLGYSRTYSQPVTQVIAQRLPATLILSGIGLALALILAVILGALALRYPRGGAFIHGLTLTVQATPAFVLGLGAILVLALGLGWFPAWGRSDLSQGEYLQPQYLVLPVLVLAITQLPWLLLTLLDASHKLLQSDSVRFSRARGLSWRAIILRQVLPLSLAPTITMLGVRLPELIVGAVLVEEVFSWGGIASALVESARNLDLPLLAFLTLASAALVIIGSLLTDISYLFLDPRVKLL